MIDARTSDNIFFALCFMGISSCPEICALAYAHRYTKILNHTKAYLVNANSAGSSSFSFVIFRRVNFSLLAQRKVAKETTLRRGRFRILPLLRTSLIETAKGGLRAPSWIPPGIAGGPCSFCGQGSAKRSDSARYWFRQTIPRLHLDMYHVRRSR